MRLTHLVIPLWPSVPPFSKPEDASLTEHFTEQNDGIDRMTDVTSPSMTLYPASGKGPHPAVLVCPGGGYSILAWNHEGEDIAALLNTIGFTAFLLKYRCPDRRTAAHADAARAMRLIRAHAGEWNVDPNRLGAMGFSAGAHLTATLCAPADPIPYPAIDASDEQPFRPNFAGLIYPAYLCNNQFELAPEFNITPDTPPCFLIQSENDPVRVENAIGWFMALKRANVKAELHTYAEGGHGYGLFRTGNPISCWGQLISDWFRRQANIQ